MRGLLNSIRYFKKTVYCDITKISYIRESPGRLIWEKNIGPKYSMLIYTGIQQCNTWT